eukprot:364341-Chlamydomonas_euryale.AAC.12
MTEKHREFNADEKGTGEGILPPPPVLSTYSEQCHASHISVVETDRCEDGEKSVTCTGMTAEQKCGRHTTWPPLALTPYSRLAHRPMSRLNCASLLCSPDAHILMLSRYSKRARGTPFRLRLGVNVVEV